MVRVAGLEPARAYAQQILMVRSTRAALVGYHWASRLWCLPIPPYPHKSDFFISEGVTNLRRVRVHHTHNSPAIFESLLRESDNCLYRGGTPHYAGFCLDRGEASFRQSRLLRATWLKYDTALCHINEYLPKSGAATICSVALTNPNTSIVKR